MSISRHQAVGAYQRWTPTAFDTEPSSGGPDAVEPPPPIVEEHAPVMPEPALDSGLPEGFQLPTAEDIERMHEDARTAGHAEGYAEGEAEGLTEGHKRGYEAGYAEGRAQAEAEAEALRTLTDNLDQALSGLDEEVAEELLTLSIEIARQVLQHSLAAHPEGVLDTIRTALLQVPQTHAQIRLNPEDIGLARDQLGEQLGHGGHRLVEDPSIARGGCRVEAAGAQVDASMETRWRRVLESLGREDAEWSPEEE